MIIRDDQMELLSRCRGGNPSRSAARRATPSQQFWPECDALRSQKGFAHSLRRGITRSRRYPRMSFSHLAAPENSDSLEWFRHVVAGFAPAQKEGDPLLHPLPVKHDAIEY